MTDQILIEKVVSADFSVAVVNVPVQASSKDAIEKNWLNGVLVFKLV